MNIAYNIKVAEHREYERALQAYERKAGREEYLKRRAEQDERREQIKRRRSTERYYLIARRRKMQRAIVNNKTEWGRRKARRNLIETEAQLRAKGWLGHAARAVRSEK